MSPGFLDKFRTKAPRPPVSIEELRRLFEAMDRDDLFRLRLMWMERYLPIWDATYGEVAQAAGWAEAKQAKHRDAMEHAVERITGWWGGEKRVKARGNEIESAVSVMTHFAPQYCPRAGWVPQARLAALQVRYMLAFIYDRESDFCVRQSTAIVYDWGQLETWWPGDSGAMFGGLPAELHRSAGDEANVLLYTVAAPAMGLAKEGRAVVEAVHWIVDTLGQDPGPFPTEGILDKGPGDALRQRQHAQAYADFHGKQPPGFLR